MRKLLVHPIPPPARRRSPRRGGLCKPVGLRERGRFALDVLRELAILPAAVVVFLAILGALVVRSLLPAGRTEEEGSESPSRRL